MSNNKISARAANVGKYEYAYLLYMKNISQKEICEKVGITPATFIKWREADGWDVKRAAATISIDQLANKLLIKASDMLDDPKFDADAFSKAMAQVKRLQKGASIDDIIRIYTGFGDYLMEQAATDSSLSSDFIQKVTTYQDKHIMSNLSNGEAGK